MTCAVSPTYTPYTSPYSTYAGYGPNLVGGSSWSTRSPGLSEHLRRTTLESSPGTGESLGRRLSPCAFISFLFDALPSKSYEG